MSNRTYAPSDFAKALELAGVVGEVTDTQARDVMTLLGLTVEDPKPGPGVYLTRHGIPVLIGDAGLTHKAGAVGLVSEELEEFDLDGPGGDLIPARVVPAEPVELTEEQVGELWDARRIRIVNWSEVNESKRMDITPTVNAALAKYGHGTTTPSREQVEEILASSWEDWTAIGKEATIRLHADAVMALLKP
ncbi:hypothetical protein [Micrococcus sp. TA1]|uniref:hypothetical protein n=1 Tax=Micrococcus sp. TA1 TaxID=681627 RepID=UPI00160820CD|nr:hypothetical protein [Micrococcus sp. TA1]MBB5748580.1 hypothetical protein [Micrococcus sp. TA1]